MLISDKQHQANCRNAEQSTGPKTPEGKAAVRLNALTYGLRARQLLLDNEDPEEYKQLWNDLLSQWKPQNRTEHLHLEQMATAQWLLARNARSERRIQDTFIDLEDVDQLFKLLDRVSTLRARLERSFTSALHELKQAQKERQAVQPKPAARAQSAAPPAQSAEPPCYEMSPGTEAPPAFCAAATPDTR